MRDGGACGQRIGLRSLVVGTVAILSMLFVASAQAVPLGITGFSGNPDGADGSIGGRFASPAQGIAVDDDSGAYYVADAGNNRIQRFDAEGNFEWALGFDVVMQGKPGNQPQNERFELKLSGAPTSGSFTLRYPVIANATSSIPFNATPGAVDLALEELPAIGSGNVDVQLAPGGDAGGGAVAGGPWIVEFVGALADTPLRYVDATNGLSPASAAPTLTYLTEGSTVLEKCSVAADCKAAIPSVPIGQREFFTAVHAGSGIPVASAVPGGGVVAPQGIAINQVTGDFYVADQGFTRIQQFDDDGNFLRTWGLNVIRSGKPGDTGAGFEICEGAATNCDRGATGAVGGGFSTNGATIGYMAVAPVGAPNAGNVLVGDGKQSRVQEFTASGQFVRAFGWDVIASGPNDAGTGFEVCRAADVCKAGTSGSGLGQFAAVGASGSNIRVAVDGAGEIFTAESSGNFRVQRFTPALGGDLLPSQFNPQIQSIAGETPTGEFALTGVTAADSPTDIAVDPIDNHLYVVKACTAAHCPGPPASTERRFYEFDTAGAGTLLETHLASYNVPDVKGFAVRSGGDSANLSSATPKVGVYLAGLPAPPHPTISSPTELTTSCATFHGAVNPEGGGVLHTFYRFDFKLASSSIWSSVPAVEPDIGSGEAPVSVEQTACGLQSKRSYDVKLVATKGGNSITAGPINFTTLASGPSVEAFAPFYDSSSSELVLRGAINPNNTATTYYFEYGAQPCSASQCIALPDTKDASAGAGGESVSVSERIAGLAPASTVHIRVVADNGVGAPVASTEVTITTPAAKSCENTAFRTGPSAALPECRAYEWVSSGDSWGSGIGEELGPIADAGGLAQFTGQAFGQPRGLPGPSTPYVARRTGTGWEVLQVVPGPLFSSGSYGGTRYMGSADQGAVLWPQSSVGQRLRGEVRWGTIGITGNESWTSELLVPTAQIGSGSNAAEYALLGAATNLSSFVFSRIAGSVSLLPGEALVSNGNSNLYQVTNGELTVVNRGGTTSSGNPLGIIGGVCGARVGGESMASAVSADGSVVHFAARPGASSPTACEDTSTTYSRLFKRIDSISTVEVSACAKATPTCTTAGNDTYNGASRDGSITFFTTSRQLTDSDSDATRDLYVYDEALPVSERLTQASAGQVVSGDHPTIGAGAEVLGVQDNSADGSRVYFAARGRLTTEATKGATNLYVYERDAAHPSGRIAFIGTLDSSDAGAANRFFALPGGEASDGRILLFTSAAPLLRADRDSARDVYRFNDITGDLSCLSCMGEGEFDVSVAGRSTQASWADYFQRARPASADVSAVVFSTKESLVDEDLNEARDVYIWRDGALGLVSANSGSAGVQGLGSGISPDGSNVFFITRTAMVGADINNSLDLYDARVGGGFAEAPPTPPCLSGDACQGSGSSTPPSEPSGTDSFRGSGNVKQPKPCKKGFVRKHGKCVKKKPKAGKHKSQTNKHSKKANGKQEDSR